MTISSNEHLEIADEGFLSGLFDALFGTNKSERWMVQPVGIAVSGDGKIYVTDPGAGGIHIIDREEKKYSFTAEANGLPFRSPVGVACSPDGKVFITDTELRRIFITDQDLDAEGEIRDHLVRPTGVAVSGDTLYVADAGKHAILLFSLEGKFLNEIGKRGSGDGEFNFPVGVTVRNSLSVVDALNYRIQEFDPKGNFSGTFGVQGNAPGTFASPKAVAPDGEGNLYVTDALMDVVQIFDRSGQLLLVFGRRGTGDGEFMTPSGIAIDGNDRIYIVDSLNRRIQIFRYLR